MAVDLPEPLLHEDDVCVGADGGEDESATSRTEMSIPVATLTSPASASMSTAMIASIASASSST